MSLLDKIHMLKKILKEAEKIVTWQEDIYTDLNVHKGNPSAHHARYTDAEVQAIIAAKLKAGSVTDTTTAAGLISVTFAEAFASTPVVIVQIENDVDYYPVMISRSTTGFTVKILKTAHVHSNPNTSAVSAGTPAGSIGAGSAHHHSNPNTSAVSAGTPSGTIGGEASHTHDMNFASGAGTSHRHSNPQTSAVSAGTPAGSIGNEASHTHSQGVTGGPSALAYPDDNAFALRYCSETSGGPVTSQFVAIDSLVMVACGSETHTHTNPATGPGSSHTHSFTGSALGAHSHSVGYSGYESSHTHAVTGTSGAGSSHSHSFSGSALGTHSHTIGDTGDESAHTHVFTGSALGTHSHTIADTDSANAGNALASTSITLSYIAMVP